MCTKIRSEKLTVLIFHKELTEIIRIRWQSSYPYKEEEKRKQGIFKKHNITKCFMAKNFSIV